MRIQISTLFIDETWLGLLALIEPAREWKRYSQRDFQAKER